MFCCMVALNGTLPLPLLQTLTLLAMVVTTGVAVPSASAQGIGPADNGSGTVELNVNSTLAQDVFSDIEAQFRSAGIEVELDVAGESGIPTQDPGIGAGSGTSDEMRVGNREYVLSDFSEFMTAAATENFDTLDKVVWTSRQIFNSKVFDELVILYGYPLETVCRDRLDEASDVLSLHGGFLMWPDGTALAYNASEYGEYRAVMERAWSDVLVATLTAIPEALNDKQSNVSSGTWYVMLDIASNRPIPSPIGPACRVEWREAETSDDGGFPEWWKPIPWSTAGTMLASDLHHLTAETEEVAYFMTANEILGLEPTTEIWARCNVREPTTLGPACLTTLAASRHSVHQNVAARQLELRF